MFFHNPDNTRNFGLTESAAFLELDGFEPEFRNVVVSLYMHMTGLLTVAGVEEKPVRSLPQYSRHLQSREFTRPVDLIRRPPTPSTRSSQPKVRNIPFNPKSFNVLHQFCETAPGDSDLGQHTTPSRFRARRRQGLAKEDLTET